VDDRELLPIDQSQLFDLVRTAFAPTERPLDAATRLMLESCHAKRADDGSVIGFVVAVLVDPVLGVRRGEPTAEPRWASPTVLVVHLDEHGAFRLS
jgi:hypothetical protein